MKENKVLTTFFKLVKEKQRILAGMLAGISAAGTIGSTTPELNIDENVCEESNEIIEGYDANYDTKENTSSSIGIEDFVTFTSLAKTSESSTLSNDDITEMSELQIASQVDMLKSTMQVPAYGSPILPEETVGQDISIKLGETFEKPKVFYSTVELTNDDVKVRIVANEEIQEVEGWTLSEDKKELTKIYDQNIEETVVIKNVAGKEIEVFISINNIDKTFEKVKIFYSTTKSTNGNVVVTIKADEELQGIRGWVLSKDKKSLTKTYTSNKTEIITIEDLAGNKQQVQIEVNNIIREYDSEIGGRPSTPGIQPVDPGSTEPICPEDPKPTDPVCPEDPKPTDPVCPEDPKPTEPICIDIASLISIDPDSLSFNYNGNPYSLDIPELPDGLKLNFFYDDGKGTDVGEHTLRIELDEKDGYVAEPVEINYEIKPAEISFKYEYNEETGEVNVIYSGIVKDDVKTLYTVNGEELENGTTKLDDYGVYKVETSIEIAPEKLNNYTFSEELVDNKLTESTIYEVKRETTWYDIETDYKEEDGKIIVNVYLLANKLPYMEDLVMPAILFNVYFDKQQLGYDPDDVYSNAEGWDGMLNDEFNHEVDEAGGHDVVISPDFDTYEHWSGLPEREKICQLTFTKLSDDNDIVIKIDDAQISTANDDYPFEYKTNANICVINPSNPVETITKPNDLMDDTVFLEYEDMTLEEYQELLQEYIDENYTSSTNELPAGKGDFEMGDESVFYDEEQTYTEVQYEGPVSVITETFEINTDDQISNIDGFTQMTEDAAIDKIVEETDVVIAEINKTAADKLEEIISGDLDGVYKDVALDKLIEEVDRAIDAAIVAAEARLDNILSNEIQEDNPMILVKTKQI